MVYTCRLNPHILVHNPCMPAGWAGQAIRITCIQRVEHPYIVRKLEKSLDIGEPTFHAEKTARYQQQTKVHVLALAPQTTLENCTM